MIGMSETSSRSRADACHYHADPEAATEFARTLLDWFGLNGRRYPWRESAIPYRVFVAECMLQRTDPGHVVAVYDEFLRRYPTPESAFQAPDKEFRELMRPLGLAQRSMLLKKALGEVVEGYDGKIPCTEDALVGLPGVGLYTARAVLCFAYGWDLALIDVNTVRVLDRVLGLRSARARPHTDRDLWKAVDTIVPTGHGRELNLAMIDFAALVCSRRSPKCRECPITTTCQWTEGCL